MVKKCMWNEWKHPKFLKFLELCQVFGGHPKLLLTIFYSQGEGGWRGGGKGGGGGGGLKWEGLKGRHSPWLNHSSIVSQGSSSIAKKHKAGRREKRHGEKDVCECQGAVQQIFSKKKKKKKEVIFYWIGIVKEWRRRSEKAKNRERRAQSERGKSAFEI